MSEAAWMVVLFGSGIMIVLAYVGYPMLLKVMAGGLSAGPPTGTYEGAVSVVLVVKNEAGRIRQRVENLLQSTQALAEIIVVCDGCTDATAEVLRGLNQPMVKLIERAESKGKPAGVNAGMAQATAEVVVLCDARQRFEPETVARLGRWFQDPTTGAVSGALEIEGARSAGGKGVDAYWKLEKAIRRMESDRDSSVGCTGAVYAVRRSAFQPMPDDTILDDVVVPMTMAQQGLRVRFDPEALAFDPQQLDGAVEQRRKIRTLAGNFQMMFRYLPWMFPGGHRLWWNLILHKYLRLAGPVLLLLMTLAAAMLLPHPLGWLGLAGTGLLVGLGLVGLAVPGVGGKLVSLPAGFLFLQWCVVKGFVYWLFSHRKGGWR